MGGIVLTPVGRRLDSGKFVLVAHDFARAYDTIDHKLLYAKILSRLPKCMANWIYHLLRDRRACAEVNGVRSRERPFRAGLPQGSVLAPTLYTLWAADLVEELREVLWSSVFVCADEDDTATLSTGATIQQALARTQLLADAMVRWANRNKMSISGPKTQLLILSQWASDAKDASIRVGGVEVRGSPHLKLLLFL